MSFSPRLGLSYVLPQQAQKHVSANETFRRLDALVQLSVKSAVLPVEPVAPSEGDAYLLPAGASGAQWGAMAEASVAAFQDGDWLEMAPRAGWRAWVEDESAFRFYNGASWTVETGAGGSPSSAPIFGINTVADATNRLAVKSDAALLSHDDVTPGTGDARFVINKNAAAKTASVIFQNGFSGRAEFGVTGDDDFHMKVSPNGATFYEGVKIRNADGKVSFPSGLASALEIASGGTGATNALAALNGLGLRFPLGNINDDAAVLLNLGTDIYGAAVLAVSNSLAGGPTAFFHARMATGPTISTLFTSGASLNLRTGPLTGTTGPDNSTNFSVDAGGKFYVENRRGFAVSYSIFLFQN